MNIEIKENLNDKNIELEKEQTSFLESTIGKVINIGLDAGIKYLLPDLIEDEVINVKDTIMENGLKEGINTAIDSALNLGKSFLGIITGKFENVNQIQKKVKNEKIINSLSGIFDNALNKINEKGKINENIINVIKEGKNIILDNISANIEDKLEQENNKLNKFENNINDWKEAFNNQDFNKMEEKMKTIKEGLNQIIPIENIIKEARLIENIHNKIEANNKNFNISELEMEAAKALA